jgi:hypothetical protein
VEFYVLSSVVEAVIVVVLFEVYLMQMKAASVVGQFDVVWSAWGGG